MRVTEQTSGNKPDWALLGILRFSLALIVAARHFIARTNPGAHSAIMQQDAYVAVFCFLAVSGFSIANSLEKSPQGFFSRRLRRLAPVYYTCLAYALIVFVASRHDYKAGELVISVASALVGMNAVFVQPWPTFAPSWSLTCEVLFYAMAPILQRWRIMVPVFVIGSVLCFWRTGHIEWACAPTSTVAPCLFWAWLLGFAFYWHRGSTAGKAALSLSLIVPVLAVNNMDALQAVVLAASCCIFWFGQQQRLSGLILTFGSFLGAISYPLYLAHEPTRALYQIAVPVTREQNLFVFLMLAILVAAVFHFVVEARANKKRPRQMPEPLYAQSK